MLAYLHLKALNISYSLHYGIGNRTMSGAQERVQVPLTRICRNIHENQARFKPVEYGIDAAPVQGFMHEVG